MTAELVHGNGLSAVIDSRDSARLQTPAAAIDRGYSAFDTAAAPLKIAAPGAVPAPFAES